MDAWQQQQKVNLFKDKVNVYIKFYATIWRVKWFDMLVIGENKASLVFDSF